MSFEPLIGPSLFTDEQQPADEAVPADETHLLHSLLSFIAAHPGVHVHPAVLYSVITYHKAGGRRNGLLTPAGSDGGRSEHTQAFGASILRAAADQTASMAEGATGTTLTQAGKNLKVAERQSPLYGSFPSVQIHFTTSQTISHSGCLACVISLNVWGVIKNAPPSLKSA